VQEKVLKSTSHIGSTIKAARLQKRWTQEQLAEKSGVGMRHIMSIENGKRNPGIETFRCLVKALGLSADAILFPEAVSPLQQQTDKVIRQVEKCSEYNRQIALLLIQTLAEME